MNLMERLADHAIELKAAPPDAPASRIAQVNFTSFKQCERLWCWAAVWRSLLFSGANEEDRSKVPCQCKIAAKLSCIDIPCECAPGSSSCPARPNESYDVRNDIETELQELTGNSGTKLVAQVARRPKVIYDHLREREFPLAAILTIGSNKHCAVITGAMSLAEGAELLEFADPETPAPGFVSVVWQTQDDHPQRFSGGWKAFKLFFLERYPMLDDFLQGDCDVAG